MSETNKSTTRQYLTTQEIADLLRVSVYTVRRWIKDGKLSAYKVGRGLRVRRADLNRWLDEHRIRADETEDS